MTPLLALTVDPWILAFSAVTVLATIWMGFRSAKSSKTASDFFVAGRSVGVGMNASAISGEYLSAASFMGVAGMVMSSGYDALWYPVCYACGYLFLLLFIAGPLRRFGAYTIPDFAEGRFDSPVFRKIAVVFVLFIGFFYTMPQMKGAGTTLSYIFQGLDFRETVFSFLAPHGAAGEALPGLNYSIGVLVVGAVITLNVALGGMKGITLVQAFQYWAKMFAISVPVFVLMAVYGHYGRQVGVNGAAAKPNIVELLEADETLRDQIRPVNDAYSAMSLRGMIQKIRDALSSRPKLTQPPWRTLLPPGTTNVTVAQIQGPLLLYATASGRTLLWQTNLNELPRFQMDVTHATSTTDGEFATLIRKGMESNGAAFFDGPHQTVFVLKSDAAKILVERNQATASRTPLPAKAPRDETWLNPFGPLTTKAAKAALTILQYTGRVSRAEYPLGGDVQWHIRQRLLSKGSFTTLDPRPQPLDEWVHVYARLISQVEPTVFGTSYIMESSPLPGREVKAEIPAGDTATVAEAVKQLLATNGLTVQRQGKVFRTFPTKDATIVPVNTKPYALLYTYSLIIALVCGTAGLPHILVRFYTNPDGVAAKRTTMWVMILIGVFYLFPPVFGVMGRNLLPELYNGIGAKGTDKIVLELPRIINERYGVLGSILSGITCAGAFAAFMSTFSGLLVSMTGALAHDVYGRMLNPKASPAQRMKMFKWCAVLVGGVAIVLGARVEKLEINFMVGQAFAIAAASYFPLLFMSVWWRHLTMKGAATGMLTGGLLALVGISLTSFTTLGLLKWDGFWAAHPLLRILCEQPAIWAVPLAITLMFVVSKLTAREVPADIRMKMLVLHAPEDLGLKQEYIQEHQAGH